VDKEGQCLIVGTPSILSSWCHMGALYLTKVKGGAANGTTFYYPSKYFENII